MKKFNRTLVIGSALVISGGLIAGLAVASVSSHDDDHGHARRHSIIKAFKLDGNGDGQISQDELLSRNNGHFKRLDSNNDGQIDSEEFNARLIAMFNRMDVNGDGLLSAEEMPKRHHGGHHHRDHDDDHDNKYRHSS